MPTPKLPKPARNPVVHTKEILVRSKIINLRYRMVFPDIFVGFNKTKTTIQHSYLQTLTLTTSKQIALRLQHNQVVLLRCPGHEVTSFG